MAAVLLVSVFLIAACGLIYELIAGTLASYLLGDSVLQFSTIIGSYLFAMGIGSYLSRFIARGLVARFIMIELMVGLVGGLSSSFLFLAFAYTHSFRLLLYLLVIIIGTLVGLEIPLLMRILKERFQFHELVAHVLTFDYLGALGASLLFPLILVPKLGMVRSALLFGIVNAGVALWSAFLFKDQIGVGRNLVAPCVLVLATLGGGFAFADRISSIADENLYADDVIFTRDTRYQRIVLTKWKDDVRLFLNSHLQFSSRDEYRYHEALVHPGLAALPGARRVLVLGGGDGLAVREILRYPTVESVHLVDLEVRVGEKATVDDYVDPPYMLSGERTAVEVNWSAGEYVPGKDIWKAFQLQGAPPPAQGVYANQPNPRGSSLWRMYLLFLMLITFVSMYSCIAKGQREVFHKSYQFNPASNAEPSFVTEVFDLPGGRSAATEVEVKADVQNNWVAFAIALINEKSGEAFDFGKDVSYYSGVDGGESWTEGGKSASVTIPEVPPGRYYLRIEPDRDKEPGEADANFARMINYEIIVRHDIPAVGMYFLILFLLTIPPIWVGFRRWTFEQQRWSESDYAPAGSDDDSSSDGDED